MACSNPSGSHKLPLLFMGKATNPRCFKYVNKAALSVVYKSQAWADAAIFTDWFNCHFVPSVKKKKDSKRLNPKSIAPSKQCSSTSRLHCLSEPWDWFNCHFVPSVKKHLIQRGLTPKALLLLNNAPAHPDCTVLVSHDRAIKAMFLRPNTTARYSLWTKGFWRHS